MPLASLVLTTSALWTTWVERVPPYLPAERPPSPPSSPTVAPLLYVD